LITRKKYGEVLSRMIEECAEIAERPWENNQSSNKLHCKRLLLTSKVWWCSRNDWVSKTSCCT
jgi:hypothetical protein